MHTVLVRSCWHHIHEGDGQDPFDLCEKTCNKMSLGVQLPMCRAAQESKDNPVIRGRPLSISHTCRFPHLLNRCTASVPCHYHPPLILNPLSWNHCRGTNIHAFGDTAGGATAPTKFYSPAPGWNLTPSLSSSLNDGTDSVGPIVPAIQHTSCHAYTRKHVHTRD